MTDEREIEATLGELIEELENPRSGCTRGEDEEISCSKCCVFSDALMEYCELTELLKLAITHDNSDSESYEVIDTESFGSTKTRMRCLFDNFCERKKEIAREIFDIEETEFFLPEGVVVDECGDCTECKDCVNCLEECPAKDPNADIEDKVLAVQTCPLKNSIYSSEQKGAQIDLGMDLLNACEDKDEDEGDERFRKS